MKKLLSLFLTLCLVTSLCAAIASGAEEAPADPHPTHAGEDGWTAIADFASLQAMEKDRSYYLTADITVPKADYTAQIAVKAIGRYVLDGCGYSILFEEGVTSKFGLFYQFERGSEVRNLTVGSPAVPFTIRTDGANVGAVVGTAKGDTVLSNVHVYADIDESGRKNNNQVGGLVGKLTGGALRIEDCTVTGSYKNTFEHDNKFFGGMVGNQAGGSLVIANCTSDVTVEPAAKGVIGGILGTASAGSSLRILGCVNKGNLTARCNVGGILGTNSVDFIVGAALVGCVNAGTITHESDTSVAGEILARTAKAESLLLAGCTGQTGKKLIGDGADSAKTVSLEMVPGAAVSTAEPAALRFRTGITLSDYRLLADLFGKENITFGTLIAKTEDVTAAGAFTMEALTAAGKNFISTAYELTDENGSERWARVEKLGDAQTETASFTGSIGQLTSADYETAYSGIGYFTVRVGEAEITVYAAYDAANSRTVKTVAAAALAEHAEDAAINHYSDSEQAVLKRLAGA